MGQSPVALTHFPVIWKLNSWGPCVMTSRIQGILMWHIINTRAVSSCNSCGNNPKVRCSHISVQAKTRQIEVIALKQVS